MVVSCNYRSFILGGHGPRAHGRRTWPRYAGWSWSTSSRWAWCSSTGSARSRSRHGSISKPDGSRLTESHYCSIVTLCISRFSTTFIFFQACAVVCVALHRCEVLLQWLGVVSEAEVGRTSSNCCVGNFKNTNFFYFCIFIVLRCDVNFSVDPLQRIMSLHFIRYFTLVYTFCTYVVYRISTDFLHGCFLSCRHVKRENKHGALGFFNK